MRIYRTTIKIICALISTVLLLSISVFMNPGTDNIKTKSSKDLTSQLGQNIYNAKADAMGNISEIKKIYKIPMEETIAPKPDENCYGIIDDNDTMAMTNLRNEVMKSALMDGQNLIFNGGYDVRYYIDESIVVICWKENDGNRVLSYCEVKVQDASQFRRKLKGDAFNKSGDESTLVMAVESNAIAAMSGDYYKFRDYGICVYQGKLERFTDKSFYPGTKSYNFIDSCFVKANGDFAFLYKGQETTEEEMRSFIEDEDVMFSLAFGPVLIEDYEYNENMNVYPIGEPGKHASRAAIGQYDTLHYLYLNTSWGSEMYGYTFEELAQKMMDKGVRHAYNLDGGQTAEIVFNNEIYNKIDYDSERRIGDCIYFATAIDNNKNTK